MHELSVTESILEIVLRHARPTNAVQVTDIYLVVGDLSSIIDNSVQFYWDILAKDSIAAHAKLHFRRIATQMACDDCGTQYSPTGTDLACPQCSSTQIHVVAGEEFYIEAIEVQDTAQEATQDAAHFPQGDR